MKRWQEQIDMSIQIGKVLEVELNFIGSKFGLTKEKFAEVINRSENFISEIEKGNNSCSVHTLYQISNALRVSTDKLLYGETMKSKEYKDKDILHEIIDRCSEDEAKVIKDIIVATYPNLDKIVKRRKEDNK